MGIDRYEIDLAVGENSLAQGLQQTAVAGEQMRAAVGAAVGQINDEMRSAGVSAEELGTTSEQATEKASTGFLNLNAAIELAQKAYHAVSAVAGEFFDLIMEGAQEETQIRQLGFAFRQAGLDAETSQGAFEEWAAQQENLTRYADDTSRQIAQQFALLASESLGSVEEIIRATSVVEDLAELSGRSIESLTMAVVRGLSGELGSLERLIGDVDENADLLSTLEDVARGGAQQLSETELGVVRLQHAWANFREQVGGFLGEALVDSGLMDDMLGWLDDVAQWFREHPDEIKTALRGIADDIGLIVDGIEAAVGFARQFKSVLDDVFSGAGDWIGRLVIGEQEVALTYTDAALAVIAAERQRLHDEAVAAETEVMSAAEQLRAMTEGYEFGTWLDDTGGGRSGPSREELLQEELLRQKDLYEEHYQILLEQEQAYEERRLEILLAVKAEEEQERADRLASEQEYLEARIAMNAQDVRSKEQIAEAEKLANAAAIKGAIGTTGSLVKQAAILGASKREMAFIDGLLETAESIRSFAFLDFVGGLSHGLSAAAFFKAAATSSPAIGGGGGGGGGGGSSAATSTYRPEPERLSNDSARTNVSGIVINLNGFNVDGYRTGLAIGEGLNRAASYNSGLALDERLFGGL